MAPTTQRPRAGSTGIREIFDPHRRAVRCGCEPDYLEASAVATVLFRRPARRSGPEMPTGELGLQDPPELAEPEPKGLKAAMTVLPMALMLSLLYALTQHMRHNEITAIRTAGVSLWRLCLPYIAVGTAGTLALFALNEYCVPDAANREDLIMHRHDPQTAGATNRDEVRNVAGFNN